MAIAARYGPPTIKMPPDRRAQRLIWKRGFLYSLMVLIAASWIATEAIALKSGWARAFVGWELEPKVYYPWGVWQWAWAFANHPHPRSLDTLVAYSLAWTLVLFVGWIVATIDITLRVRRTVERPFDMEGSSHWATPQEIDKTGFVDTDPHEPGIYIGQWTDPRTGEIKWMRDTSNRHVGLYAPTRAGKGVSVIIPTLLTWSGSIVANDPKGELYRLTAAARIAMGQYALKHDPTCTDGSGAKFNLLDEVRTGTVFDVKDAQQIASYLVDPLGMGMDTGGDNDHWRKVAWEFLTGAILHVVYAPSFQDRTLHGLDAFLSSDTKSEEEVLEEMLFAEHDPAHRYGWLNEKQEQTSRHPIVAAAARSMLNRPAGERGSAMSSAKSYTALYKDPVIAENTSSSDFSIDDIMHHPKGVSLYLINYPNEMLRIRPHMRALVNMINSRFTGRVEFENDGQQKKNYAHPLLFCQDEFTSTHGKLDTFVNALAFTAGYGIRCLIVVQDYAQLEATYGEAVAQTIIANMHTNVYYASTNDKTAKRIEEMIGTMTYYEESVSRSMKQGRSYSENYKRRPLIFAPEFMSMNEDDGIVVVAGRPPMYVKKIIYFKEPEFKKLVAIPPSQSQIIPLDERTLTRTIAKERAENKRLIDNRRERANGFENLDEIRRNYMVQKGQEAETSSADAVGDAGIDPTAPLFDGNGPARTQPAAVPPPAPQTRDEIDEGLDSLDFFAEDPEAA